MIARVISVVILATFLIGCSAEHQTLGKPEIKEISNQWGEVTASTTEIVTKIKVYNPNPVPLPLKDVLTEVYINGIKIGEGSALKAEIKANSESTILIHTKLENSKIPKWWILHIKNGEKSNMHIKGYLVFDLLITEFKYPIDMTKLIETDILAGLTSAVPKKVKSGTISLEIESVKSYWGEVNEDYTEIITEVKIRNENSDPISVSRIHHSVLLNDIALAQYSSDIDAVIQPKSDTTLRITTKLDNKMLDEWWVSHIRNGEKSKVEVSLQSVVEIFGEEVTLSLVKRETVFKTNLLG